MDQLIAVRSAGQALGRDLLSWLGQLPKDVLAGIEKEDLLDEHHAALGKPLLTHVEDFRGFLSAKGATLRHANLVANRAKLVVAGCGFRQVDEVSAEGVLSYLGERRRDRVNAKGEILVRGISAQTSNFYLQAVKQLCRFLVRERRAIENPIAHVAGLNVRLDRRRDRRALTVDECRRLIAAASHGARVLGMAGNDRAVLYRIALETGLRWNELRTLVVRSFNLRSNPPTVTVAAAYSKHRREDVLPLREETAQILAEYLALKLADAPAFPMPPQPGAGADIMRG